MQLCTFYYALFRSGVVSRIRIGLVEQLNYLPLCYALKEGPALGVKLVKDSPTSLNKLFLRGKLDVTPLSLIEYARNMDFCQPLQNFSITTEGKVPFNQIMYPGDLLTNMP
jgi:predicted solute-binding protein